MAIRCRVLCLSAPPRLSFASSTTASADLLFPKTSAAPLRSPRFAVRNLSVSASSMSNHPGSSSSVESVAPDKPPRWKPMCLYHTQGKCTMMDDSSHLEKFNHDISLDLRVNVSKSDNLYTDFDNLLVLDLEGKVEILEFPVLMIDTKTLNCTGLFHRFVRPVRMSEHRINEYIEGKYGKLGVDRVWHDTAIPFKEVLLEFEAWLTTNHLLDEGRGVLRRAAFVTCGNWDLKTKIPQQCKDSNIRLPAYFMEWINLKDIFLNYYKRRATGMMPMMRELRIPLLGSHHLGIDDTKNITRVLQQMIADGSRMKITARRRSATANVEFLLENRIR